MSDDASTIDLRSGKFPVLTSSNFTEWLDLAQTVLISRGLWEYATGEITEGPSLKDKQEFRKEDAKAVAFLKLAAGREQRAHLLGLTSSKDVLEKLKSVHQVSQLERVQALLSEFHTFKIKDSIDLGASKLTQLQLEIAAADRNEKPSDTIKKTVLLHGLPDEYQSTVFALKAAGLSKITFDDMVQRLKEVETAMKGQTDSSQDLARFAGRKGQHQPRKTQNRNQGDQTPTTNRRTIKCYHCHKTGHVKNECWLLHGRPEQQRRPQQSPAMSQEAAWGTRYQSVFAHQVGYGKPEQQEWVLDSGCTKHMTFDRGHFIDYKKHGGLVTVANGKTLKVQGGGTIEVPIQGKMTEITGVIYVPDLGYNLLSVSQLGERGMQCHFDGTSATLMRNGRVVATAGKQGKTYVLKGYAQEEAKPASLEAGLLAQPEKSQQIAEIWHQRLGHPGKRKTELLSSDAVEGVPRGLPQVDCEQCRMNKATQSNNKAPAPRAEGRLERVHMDFWGPYKTPTLGGSKYMLTITDDFSRKSWIYLTKGRTDVYQTFRNWRAQAELDSGSRLKAIRIDNAPEFVKLGKGLERDGIRTETTVAYTPSQNGVAERLNRTLITKTRTLLSAAELPVKLWGEAVHTANYLRNNTPMDTDAGQKSPEEIWTGKKPSLGHLRTFGCAAYVHIPAVKRDKLDKTAFKGIFVGYGQTNRQYRIFNPADMTVKLYSNVKFDEQQKAGRALDNDQNNRGPEDFDTTADIELFETGAKGQSVISGHQRTEPVIEISDDDSPTGTEGRQQTRPAIREDEQSEHDRESDEERPVERRPQRDRRIPRRYENAAALKVDYKPATPTVSTPTSFDEAVNGRESRQWKLAIEDQLRSLEANHTWEVVDKPKHANVISNKWVFKVKTLPNGQIDKYKARLCARGFTQEYGVDYFETFAPVVRMESLRILLALATAQDWEIHQMDVVSAYLSGDLEDEAYMEVPKGLDLPPGKVLKLNKGMPGLKQSGRVWNKKITDFFEEHGLKSLPAEHSVFVNSDRTLVVALYVDDLLLFARTEKEMQPLKQALSSAFDMKDLGEAKYVLGISITRNRREKTLVIDQEHYIKDLLQEHNLEDSRIVTTPAEGYVSLIANQPGDLAADVQAYQRLLGKLNWLVRACRPDIAFVVQNLSRYSHDPGNRHMGGAQRLLRYLSGTRKYGIRYSGQQGLAGHTDSDFAADQSRKSTMGYIFLLAGGAVTWSSKIQRSVSTSTAEAEYHALAYAGKEAAWIRNFLRQLGFAQEGPTTIYGDNQSALALVENPEFHARTKHIDVSAHYIRELVEDNVVKVQYRPTGEMLADCLTKPLKTAQHQHNVEAIGIQDRK